MSHSFQVSTTVRKDVHHAWEYYFNQINSWWPRDYFSSSKTRRFIIETFIGGKVFEDFGEGGGVIWGDVIAVDYPYSLQIRGNLTKDFGGPVITYEKFQFNAQGNNTEVVYSVDFVGEMTEKGAASLKKGWHDLLENRFTSYCQSR